MCAALLCVYLRPHVLHVCRGEEDGSSKGGGDSEEKKTVPQTPARADQPVVRSVAEEDVHCTSLCPSFLSPFPSLTCPFLPPSLPPFPLSLKMRRNITAERTRVQSEESQRKPVSMTYMYLTHHNILTVELAEWMDMFVDICTCSLVRTFPSVSRY